MDTLMILQRRRAELEDRIAQCNSAILAATREIEEIAIAERLISRLSADNAATQDSPESQELQPPLQEPSLAPFEKRRGTPKPKNTPSTAEMILIAFDEAGTKEQKKSLTSAEIMKRIEQKWWPGVSSSDVSPNIVRLMSKNKLERIGKEYRVIANDT